MKAVIAAGLSVGLAAAVVGMAVLASAVSLLGVGGGAPAASGAATAQIPPAMLTLYQQAAATCPGLPWTILAAIGTVESDNGRSNLPGVHSGANSAGAEGPMQFEPATFAAYDAPVPAGGAVPPSPYDPTDAVYAAARLLCADGASGGRRPVRRRLRLQPLGLLRGPGAGAGPVLRAPRRRTVRGTLATTAGAGAVAVSWALSQIGTPYVWGGETPGVGFDCSGLVQAAYAAAGVALPRVAQDQYDRTPKLETGHHAGPGRPRLLRRRARFHRPCRAVRRHGGRPGRHDRRAPHGSRRTCRGLPRHAWGVASGACSSWGRRGRRE